MDDAPSNLIVLSDRRQDPLPQDHSPDVVAAEVSFFNPEQAEADRIVSDFYLTLQGFPGLTQVEFRHLCTLAARDPVVAAIIRKMTPYISK